MRLSPQRGLMLVLLVLLVGVVVVVGIDRYALRRLQRDLGSTGEEGVFPTAFFRKQIPNGATPAEVCRAMRGYDRIRFYLVPLGGGPDSVVVQHFVYRQPIRPLNVGVEYRNGRVGAIYTDNEGISRARELSRAEAHARLGVPAAPPAGDGSGCP